MPFHENCLLHSYLRLHFLELHPQLLRCHVFGSPAMKGGHSCSPHFMSAQCDQ
jgi:hypothetical protein